MARVGISRTRHSRVCVGVQRLPQGRQGHLVHPQGPGQGVLLQRFNVVLPADDDAGLGPSQELGPR